MYKNKRLAFVALVITALTLTGCSTGSETAKPTTDVPVTAPSEAMFMPNEGAPKPDDAQSAKLLTGLGKISPALNKPVSVERSRAVCEDILAGKVAPELSQRVTAVFSTSSEGVLSENQVTDVLKVINESGFCKK